MKHKVYVAKYDTIEDRLVVYELLAKPWGEHEVQIDGGHQALGFKTRVPNRDVHPSAEAATLAWLKNQRVTVQRLERQAEVSRHALEVVENGGVVSRSR